MINTSDTRRLVEKSLVKAIEFRIGDNPTMDRDELIKDSLAQFNKAFEGIYKIDNVKLTKDFIGISISKDKDSGDEELVCA